jgi:hypothetical protein
MPEPGKSLKIKAKAFWCVKVRIDEAPGWRDIFLDVDSCLQAVELMSDRYSIIAISQCHFWMGEMVPVK